MDLKHAVAQRFEAAAAAYASSVLHAAGPDLRALVDAAQQGDLARVLDVGCGPGHTTLALAPHAGAVVGLDLSAAMLTQGRRLAAERGLANLTFEQGDVEQLPFADASFDTVTSRFSAHHYPDPAAALAQIARVLAPGGTFLLVDTVAPETPVADTYLNAVEVLRDPSHARNHTTAQWLAMLAAAGLTGAVLGSYPLRIDFTSWVARTSTPPAAAAQIRALLTHAPAEVRAVLLPEDDGSFTIPVALIRATKTH